MLKCARFPEIFVRRVIFQNCQNAKDLAEILAGFCPFFTIKADVTQLKIR